MSDMKGQVVAGLDCVAGVVAQRRFEKHVQSGPFQRLHWITKSESGCG